MKKDGKNNNKNEPKKPIVSQELSKSDNNKKNEKKNDNNEFDDFCIIDSEPMEQDDIKEDTYTPNENIWEVIPITSDIIKKTNKNIVKSIFSSIAYGNINFKEKFSESTSKNPIIIFNQIYQKCSPQLLRIVKDSFIYMSYRTGLINTSFLPGGKNKYSSDCGWGCMIRCCQMLLSRAMIQKEVYDNQIKDKELISMDIRKKIIYFFYDKFLDPSQIGYNIELKNIYEKLIEKNYSTTEIIAPYSIYMLTLLGKCPKIFTSDLRMISCFIHINKTLFSNYMNMIYFKKGYIDKNELFNTFCKKVEYPKKNENYLEYKSQKYQFDKWGTIFISLRLGLYNIEKEFQELLPKFFNNLHNNIGMIGGKNKRAYYFIGMNDNRLIFADPHFNQKVEENEDKMISSYRANDFFLMDIKELSPELTVGIALCSQNDFEQFLNDLSWFQQICPNLLSYKE